MKALLGLLLLGACAHPVVPPIPIAVVFRADTVQVQRRQCIFLTLRDGTHTLMPNQPKQCRQAFLRWAALQP